MSVGVVIRRAVRADAKRLAEFGARTFNETFGAVNRPEDMAAYLAKTYSEALQSREIDDPRVITLLAESEGQLIGFAQLRIQDDDAIEIARFYVGLSFQGRGVAQSLMDASRDAARSTGKKRIWLGVWERNERAIAFYAKCGFRRTGSHPFRLGSDLQTDRVMEWP